MQEFISQLWIDESGDGGFKFEKGSSGFLVLAAVYVRDGGIETIEKSLMDVRNGLNYSQDHEFKFSRCKNDVKEKLLRTLIGLSIQYKAIVVDKQGMAASVFRTRPHQLYAESIKRLLYDNDPPLKNAAMIIDEATAKVHQKEFNHILKQHLSKNMVQKIRQTRSQSDSMIQIADLIAGSIYRRFEKGDGMYHDLIKPKEKILIEF